jgi:hypothetical protein
MAFSFWIKRRSACVQSVHLCRLKWTYLPILEHLTLSTWGTELLSRNAFQLYPRGDSSETSTVLTGGFLQSLQANQVTTASFYMFCDSYHLVIRRLGVTAPLNKLQIKNSWMWRRVDLVWTDVSEERIASIFRIEESAREQPAWAGCSWKIVSIL